MAIDSLTEMWKKICDYCLEKNWMTDVGLKVWIEDLVPEIGETGDLLLITNSDYKKKTIDRYYLPSIERACSEVSGIPMNVEVVVREEEAPEKVIVMDSESAYTFENFVVGESNKFAHAAAMAVAGNPSANIYNPLFIYGNSGVGKTHLMLAIKNSINKDFPDKKTLFLRGEQFTNELIQAIRSQTTDEFHNRFRSVDVLLIDDIHFIAGKDYAQEEFFNTFNALYPDKEIVVTSDRPPKEIKTLELRIRSRFESGVLADMSPPDFETRVGILKNKAEQVGLEIDDDILYYISEQVKINVRQLEGIIKKLQAHVMIHSDKITLPIVQGCIRDIITEDIPDPITVEKIVEEVSRSYKVSVDDIFSKKRSAEISLARQVSMYLVDQILGLSSKENGKRFGKDHTTVLYAIDKVVSMINTDESQNKLIDDIMANIISQGTARKN